MKPALVCHRVRIAAAAGALDVPALPAAVLELPLAERPGYRLFNVTLECLRDLCPPSFPVIIQTKDLGLETNGYCYRTKSRFVIHLARHLDCERAVETLLHEWAHALAWNHLHDVAVVSPLTPHEFNQLAHGPEFGIAYAEVWKLFSGIIVPGIQAFDAAQEPSAA